MVRTHERAAFRGGKGGPLKVVSCPPAYLGCRAGEGEVSTTSPAQMLAVYDRRDFCVNIHSLVACSAQGEHLCALTWTPHPPAQSWYGWPAETPTDSSGSTAFLMECS